MKNFLLMFVLCIAMSCSSDDDQVYTPQEESLDYIFEFVGNATDITTTAGTVSWIYSNFMNRDISITLTFEDDEGMTSKQLLTLDGNIADGSGLFTTENHSQATLVDYKVVVENGDIITGESFTTNPATYQNYWNSTVDGTDSTVSLTPNMEDSPFARSIFNVDTDVVIADAIISFKHIDGNAHPVEIFSSLSIFDTNVSIADIDNWNSDGNGTYTISLRDVLGQGFGQELLAGDHNILHYISTQNYPDLTYVYTYSLILIDNKGQVIGEGASGILVVA